MNVIHATLASDFHELALSNALEELRCMPEEATVFCSHHYTLIAEEIRKKHGCKVILVPCEILSSSFAWAVSCEHGTYWSEAP